MDTYRHTMTGIDDISVYIPKLYLPISTLAEVRGIAYAKLNKGLGLTAMAVPDAGEDAATMMANAVKDLIEKNNLDPRTIGRIYLGTESALDGAKPTATYALQMLEAWLASEWGPRCFAHCDTIDMTFACIGAVDAMQNSLDWVAAHPDRIAIVAAADNAKYELGSTGEYTQGAGSIAVLLKHNPRLLAIDSVWGVGMEPVYDFYKPLRKVSKAALISEVLQLANRNHVDVEQLVQQLQKSISVTGVLDSNEEDIYLHKDTPVFDGPYSNDCYQARIREALAHYARQAGHPEGEPLATTWDRLIFHLPYAFQARRMFGEIFWDENAPTAQAATLQAQAGMEYPQRDAFADEAQWQAALQEFNRAVTKTTLYHDFINQRIAPSEWASSLVGNMYAGSILLALVSTLEVGWKAHTLSAGHTFGFFAYGSGSKSKVFTARLQPEWEKVAARLALGSQLENRIPLEYDTYEKLHRKVLKTPLYPQLGCFYESAMDDAGVRTHRLPQKQQVG